MKRPKFIRQEGYRLVRLKKKWRKPRGKHSKLRMHEKARGRHPGPGYRSPKSNRGMIRSRLKEVRISTPSEIKNVDPKKEIIIIAGSVGKKKALEITMAAENRGIKVRNKPVVFLKKPKSSEKESGKEESLVKDTQDKSERKEKHVSK